MTDEKAQSGTDLANFDQFLKLDIRCGTIVEVSPFSRSAQTRIQAGD